MLFNGKYYNKPGHLGMTRQQLKEALAGGGGKLDYEVVTITDDGFDKSFAEIAEWLADEKLIIVVSGTQITNRIYEVDEHTIQLIFDDYDFDNVNNRINFIRVQITLLDDNTFTDAEIEARVTATFVS